MKIIDVSEHQGQIDWNAVKDNVDGAILRAGYGRGTVDKYFHRNAEACNRLGIPCGCYWFSYAYTADMARLEAAQLLLAARQHRMELPLAYDFEGDSVEYAAKKGVTVTVQLARDMAQAFCDAIEAARFYCMIYSNPDYISRFYGTLAGGRYDLWLAEWKTKPDLKKPPRKCGIWQWTNKGSIPGIVGNVDVSEAYNDYRSIILRAGLNELSAPELERPWYAEAQDWAKSIGISDGDRPEEPATRAEVWQMLYRYYRKNIGSGMGDQRLSGLLDE